jgi:hypothetical protein
MERLMAKKKQAVGEVNKSQAIRELIKANPKIKASEAAAALAEKGIQIRTGLFYIVKGKLAGRKRRRKIHRDPVAVASIGTAKKSDALATIRKVQAVAAELGGLKVLKQIVDALSE